MKYVVVGLVSGLIVLTVLTASDIGRLRRDFRNLNDRVERIENRR